MVVCSVWVLVVGVGVNMRLRFFVYRGDSRAFCVPSVVSECLGCGDKFVSVRGSDGKVYVGTGGRLNMAVSFRFACDVVRFSVSPRCSVLDLRSVVGATVCSFSLFVSRCRLVLVSRNVTPFGVRFGCIGGPCCGLVERFRKGSGVTGVYSSRSRVSCGSRSLVGVVGACGGYG